ncbi:MAG TPA: nucleotidyltransferase domain-containing protein [Spirochaetota bacterium]|nr:nucleotidyltransferase domain-containing protein [Spirochaetota bacterium]
MTKYGLNEDVINKINNVFIKYPEIEEVILYGSRAKGNFKNRSDIDLTITGENINLTLINKIINDLDDLLLPYTIDLSDFKSISNSDLIDHIKRVGIVFYKKDIIK